MGKWQIDERLEYYCLFLRFMSKLRISYEMLVGIPAFYNEN